ncbi:2'-deoxymugineic-acid 2'-dioxygenase-like [Phragmites australis]|uniref:2'-deoxymugineic-acid 2'-dioxygenase-like n=1 Tax=Phragmites australis TaxID=29695 RepID=UPI002D77D602|nr:2'-deoxymugineic-acid 2'-dioxygenase-like [Phragmites australis]
MELLTNAPLPRAVPDKYVFPPEKRPGNNLQLLDPSIALPVVDLRGGRDLTDADRRRVVRDIIDAGKEFGFFQVVNHGVEDGAVRAFRDAAAEFFALRPEEKLPYYSDDQSRPFRVASSTTYDKSETRYWRDYLKLQCFPVDKFVHQWPPKPDQFRDCLGEYIVQVQHLAATLLELIAEGLGLDAGFFRGELSGGDTQMNVNYYPPCPDPSLTLGLLPHCDRHLLTVLSQGDVSGLQAKYGGGWIAVQPIPGAFVINFGHQMEIATNGLLRSVEHRAVTNAAKARMSVATLIMPATECLIAPAPELVGEEDNNPAKYRAFRFSEFIEAYDAAAASRDSVLDYFKI